MSAQRLLLVIAFAIAIILTGLWFVSSETGANGSLVSGLTAGESPDSLPESSLDRPGQEPAGPDAPSGDGPRSALSAEDSGAPGIATDASFDTADARWLEIQVHAPGSRPSDDSLKVLALASTEEHESDFSRLCRRLGQEKIWSNQKKRLERQSEVAWTRQPVENGRARVPIPRGTTRAGFLLDGRFLYLERPLEIPVDDATRQVTLEASVGAHVRIDCHLPEAATTRGLSLDPLAGEISMEGSWMFRRGSRSAPVDYKLDLADGTSFELRGVPPGTLVSLFGEIEKLAPYQQLGLSFEPDEERTLEVHFAMGGAIRGRVLDPSGDPLEGVQVGTTDRNPMPIMGGREAATTLTDSQGRFQLLGTPAGKVQLEAQADGWLSKTTEEYEVADGQSLDNLNIVLDRGQRIAGRVLFPDGQPAPDARLKVQADGGGRSPWQGRVEPIESTTDLDGRFTVWGLPEGTSSLTARLGREPERPTAWRPMDLLNDGLDLMEDPAPKEDTLTGWRAMADGIEAGTEDIELVLIELVAVRGTVRDDLGQPFSDFEVSARPGGQAATPWARAGRVQQEVEASQDGSFELWGLGPGDWTIQVTADGYASEDGSEVALTVPYPGEALELVLARAATLSGIVLDPLGQPARARVSASDGANPAWLDGRGQRTESDADGTFLLEDVALGTLAVRAESDDWASSEPINVELAAAQSVANLTLSLRVGGRITGEVFDAQGEPSAGRQVSISANAMGGGMFGNGPTTDTDSSGFFALDHVTPGTWIVTAGPSDAEKLEMMASSDGPGGFMKMFSESDTASVEVVDGEETHVTLGADPIVPVRLFGRVTQAGDPVPAAQLVAIAEGGSLFKGMKMTSCDEDGSFEITVDRPGAYTLTVQRDGRGSQVRFPIDVPEQEEFSLDLKLPSGRIEGTVYDSDGAPLPGIQVRYTSEAEPQFMTGAAGARTDSEGRFEFTGLWSGTYTLRAGAGGGAGSGVFGLGGNSRYGTSILSGVDVDTDSTTRAADLTLVSASSVGGTVRDQAGAPVRGASIFVRDAQGRLLSAISGTVTNAAGDFEYAGVSPGMVTVSARTRDSASPTSAPVRVEPGDPADVDLTLETGTLLIVQVVDEEGEALRGKVRVFDENDFEVGGMMTVDGFQEMFTEGFSSRETRIGPLPAGKYRVEASDDEGHEARKPVTLKGQETRKIKLRLKE